MTDGAASQQPPADRRGRGHPGAWSAATDPVGQPSRPADAELAGAELADREDAAGEPAGGAVPAPSAVPGPGAVPGRGTVPGPGAGPGRASSRPVSQSAPTRRPDTRAPGPRASDARASDARSSVARRSDGRRPGPPGGELLNDLQRWLLRSSAKSMRREIEGQVRRTFSGGAQSADVWGTATTEPSPGVGESPECAWCPICRAARRMRESGPGLGSQLSGASDVVATAVQDAIVAVDAVLSRPPVTPGPSPRADRYPRSAGSAGDEAGRAQDEPGHRG
jgi:hypothetical protein